MLAVQGNRRKEKGSEDSGSSHSQRKKDKDKKKKRRRQKKKGSPWQPTDGELRRQLGQRLGRFIQQQEGEVDSSPQEAFEKEAWQCATDVVTTCPEPVRPDIQSGHWWQGHGQRGEGSEDGVVLRNMCTTPAGQRNGSNKRVTSYLSSNRPVAPGGARSSRRRVGRTIYVRPSKCLGRDLEHSEAPRAVSIGRWYSRRPEVVLEAKRHARWRSSVLPGTIGTGAAEARAKEAEAGTVHGRTEEETQEVRARKAQKEKEKPRAGATWRRTAIRRQGRRSRKSSPQGHG